MRFKKSFEGVSWLSWFNVIRQCVPQLSYACILAYSLQFIYACFFVLSQNVLFICSVIFTISRSVDCGRETDTREERREEIRGEGRKDRGTKYMRKYNFQKFLKTKPSTRNHPLVAPKCSKTHLYIKVKTNKCSGDNSLRTSASGRGGGRIRRESEWKEIVWAPTFSSKFTPMYNTSA